ncbi:ornithine cyclodeaminase family protein [Kineobactrum salinum]|uniref:Ornithine cyclodeaminase family protein n=1 Tax=Kineobactrum salinum TaxID=2708301 RepID=A0A6C0U2W9_9GAMM|nr:ornithine cyclodeaminase family protein [Kineobactrum salinum]QIB66520.1 ornithine cyclodeaminase family protein [Kineobactrum salinum]
MMKHYTASDIAHLCSYPDLIEEMRNIFLAKGDGVQRQHLKIGSDGALLMMPAVEGERYFGVKLTTVFPANPEQGKETIQGIFCLFDRSSGTLLATFDASELTARRTAAASALAASYLSRPDSTRLGILGAGKLPVYFVAAYRAVRPIEHVNIWARSGEKAVACARRLTGEFNLPVTVTATVGETILASDIVSSLTSSTSPFVESSHLKPGLHIDLVGAHTPAMSEATPLCFQSARVFVDSKAGAVAEAGDLMEAIRVGALATCDIEADFRELVLSPSLGRREGAEITLFKSVGVAAEDLAAATLIYETGQSGFDGTVAGAPACSPR